MDDRVYLAVLCAALLHAGWNSLVKTGGDRFLILVTMSLVHATIGVIGLAFVPAPAPEALPWIVAGALLHTGYQILLAKAYDHADLSLAYPLARGTGPLLVFLISVLVLDVGFRLSETVAVIAISAGILLMARRGGQHGRVRIAPLGYALGTAVFIAGYTTVDGIGARIAGTPSGFLFWMFIGNALSVASWALISRGRGVLWAMVPVWKTGVVTGGFSLVAYWIVVWAFTVAPIALVASLRESSILFATLLGAFAMREDVNAWRWISVGLIAAGAMFMRF